MNIFPNFIIIGAGKCGTTSLHDYLNQHPQIYICPQKETFFFINEETREKLKPWGALTRVEDYCSLFQDAPKSSVLGEISTNYYAYPESAQLIYNHIPTVKIIAIFRDPAERAFSSYQMHVRQGIEQRSFEQVLSPDSKYVKRGFYFSEIIPYFKTFERQSIKILLYDDLCQNPLEFMQDLFNFIGVDNNFIPDMSKKGRKGGLPKNKYLNNLLTKPNLLRRSIAAVLKLTMPLQLRQQIRSGMIKKNTYKAQLSPEARKQLIEIYKSDILKLQDLIERDLSNWLYLS
ncbi:sulfotransferase family protein [Coleofasciculus sp.]|uniref:sulfotransferase family protein n=1 Tax=Coleofasciculus sp. TaxID=3100458 RepID=UPI003A3448FE